MRTSYLLVLCCCPAISPPLTPAARAAQLQPVYARIALPMDGGRVIAVMLTASQGSEVRDAAYFDTNFSGQFEENERHTSSYGSSERPGSKFTSFSDVRIPAAVASAQPPCRMSLYCGVTTIAKQRLEFVSLDLQWTMTDAGKRLDFHGVGTLRTAASLKSAPLCGAAGRLALRLSAKPPQGKETKTGLGAILGWDGLQVSQAPPSRPVHLEVRNQAGRIVHTHEGSMADMGMG
jgi:hypothetical protein